MNKDGKHTGQSCVRHVTAMDDTSIYIFIYGICMYMCMVAS